MREAMEKDMLPSLETWRSSIKLRNMPPQWCGRRRDNKTYWDDSRYVISLLLKSIPGTYCKAAEGYTAGALVQQCSPLIPRCLCALPLELLYVKAILRVLELLQVILEVIERKSYCKQHRLDYRMVVKARG